MGKTRKIEEGNIADLKQDDKNANAHRERGKELLQKSMHELGAGRSILVDANNVIIAGNNSTETAIAEGITKTVVVETTGDTLVVVKRIDLDLNDPGESGRKARQMAIVDNASALAGIEFDIEAVQEIEEQWGFEADEWGVEFPEEEKEVPAAEEDEGAGALPSHPVTVKGDVWELISEGKELRHRVMCGDSTDSDAVSVLMDGGKSDIVFTDPPYNINYGNIKHSKFKVREIQNDNMSHSEFRDFCQGFTNCISLFNNGCVYVAGPPGVDGRIMFSVLDEAIHCSTVIIWNKDQFTLGRGKYQNKYEPIWFGWCNDGSNFTEDRTLTNVWDLARPKKSEEHPTMKPVELVAMALNHASKTLSIVLDLFLGSGTTLIACEQLSRNCRGMELDEKYCDVIVRRWIAQMEKDGSKWKVFLNGEERADMVGKLLEQGN